MKIDFSLLAACLLIGLGISGVLFRKNILSITISTAIAFLGGVLLASLLEKEFIFSFCIVMFLTSNIAIGCSIAYRRYITLKTVNIDEGNELRN